jgi:hypothetical protein
LYDAGGFLGDFGETGMRSLPASAMNSGSFTVSSKAARSRAMRSAGAADEAMNGRPSWPEAVSNRMMSRSRALGAISAA